MVSPRDPAVWVFYNIRAAARLSLGDYEAALGDARRAIRHPAAAYYSHATLASALALLDKREEARCFPETAFGFVRPPSATLLTRREVPASPWRSRWCLHRHT